MKSPHSYLFEDDGSIPNHPDFPMLVYPGVLTESQCSSQGCRDLFMDHGWTGNWLNGIYSHHHYHSTAHEVLGVISGSAQIHFGGPRGKILEVEAGDVAVLPAGMGHCNRGSSGDFLVVGGYAGGRQWDMNTGRAGERPQVLENIKQVPVPDMDPVYGAEGPLPDLWGK